MQGAIEALILLAVMTLFVLFSTGKYVKIADLFKDKKWFMHFLVLVGFSLYILKFYHGDEPEKDERLKESVKKGIFAFIIALLSEAGLSIAPFWAVFVVSYFLDGWV